MNGLRYITFSAVALFPLFVFSDDAEWGHLTGRFLYDGDPPPAKTVRVTRDTAAFGDTIHDESLMVNEKNHGIANIIVYLYPKDDELPVHPSYALTANSKVELAMQNGRFVPHILLLRTTQTMTLCNKDKVVHNARIDFLRNTPMSPASPARNSLELHYSEEERFPCPVACAIHPWMRGFVLLRSDPYMAKTDTDGRFMIKNLAVGEHVFRLWHERTGFLRDVRVGPLTTDSRGRLTVTIRNGHNELTDTRLAPKIFVRDD